MQQVPPFTGEHIQQASDGTSVDGHVWLALVDPNWSEKEHSPEELERVHRYRVYQVAMALHKMPEEVLDMDAAWFQDIVLFSNTETVARRKERSY